MFVHTGNRFYIFVLCLDIPVEVLNNVGCLLLNLSNYDEAMVWRSRSIQLSNIHLPPPLPLTHIHTFLQTSFDKALEVCQRNLKRPVSEAVCCPPNSA